MKASSLFIALFVCLSRGEQWTRYPDIYPKFEYQHLHHDVDSNWGQDRSPYYSTKLSDGVLSPSFLPPNLRPNSYNSLSAQVTAYQPYPGDVSTGNQYLFAQAKKTDNVNVYSTPLENNYSGNEILRNNGFQNNLSLNARRRIGNDVDIKQGVKKVNNFIYFLNKTNEHHRIEDQQIPFPVNQNVINPGPNGFYPDNNDWNQPDHDECYVLLDVIRDIRALLHISDISAKKHNLRGLFRYIRTFILNNNLQYAPFSVVVYEIGRVLTDVRDHNNLREDEVVQILQHFKNRELRNLLLEISSHRETNIQVVVSKLAQLLYRLKQVLIQRKYSQEIIRLVINRAVQLSVPLVGYYVEKECKIKTQQYIVQNLEVALDVNLESVKHVESVDELQTDLDFGSLGNLELQNSGDIEHRGNLGNVVNIGGLESIVNAGGLANQENLGGLGNLGRPQNPGELGNQGNMGLGVSANLGEMGNLGNLGGLGGPEIQGDLGRLVGQGNQETSGPPGILGSPLGGGLVSPGILGSIDNHANPGLEGLGKFR